MFAPTRVADLLVWGTDLVQCPEFWEGPQFLIVPRYTLYEISVGSPAVTQFLRAGFCPPEEGQIES